MTIPQRALSALVCILAATALGIIARLPLLHDRMEHRPPIALIQMLLLDEPAMPWN